jgi:hypothetical protein
MLYLNNMKIKYIIFLFTLCASHLGAQPDSDADPEIFDTQEEQAQLPTSLPDVTSPDEQSGQDVAPAQASDEQDAPAQTQVTSDQTAEVTQDQTTQQDQPTDSSQDAAQQPADAQTPESDSTEQTTDQAADQTSQDDESGASQPFTITVPTIGTVDFQDGTDKNGNPDLVGVLDSQKYTLDFGFLQIQDGGELQYLMHQGLFLKAKATLFERTAKLSIDFLGQSHATLLVKPRKIVQIPFLSQQLPLNQIKLLLSDSAAPTLSAMTNVFKQKTALTITNDSTSNTNNASFSVPSFVTGFITKNTKRGLNKIPLKNVQFTITNVGGDDASVSFNGMASLLPLKLPLIPSHFLELGAVQGTIKDNVLTMKMPLDSSALPMAKNLKNLVLSISSDISDDSNPVTIEATSAKSTITLPGLGSFDVGFVLRLVDNQFILETDLKELTLGELKLSNVHITMQDKLYLISGDAILHGHTFAVSLQVEKPQADVSQTKSQTGMRVTLNGQLKDATAMYPFKATHLPHIEDISFKDVRLKLVGRKLNLENIMLAGTATILKIPFESQLLYQAKSAVQKNAGLVLKASIAKGWKMSDAFEFLKEPQSQAVFKTLGFSFDDIDFSNGVFIATNAPYQDQDLGVKVASGLTLLSKLNPSQGPLSKVTSLMGGDVPQLMMYGTIPANKKQFKFGVYIGRSIMLDPKSGLRSGPTTLEITGQPSISLSASLFFRPPGGGDELELSARMEPRKTEIALSATMLGRWRNIFGLKGLDLENLVLDAGISYASGIPDEIGMGGTMYIGNVTDADKIMLLLQGKASADLDESYFETHVKNLTFNHIINIALATGVKLNLKAINLPDFGLDDLEFKMAPKSGNIGQISYQAGTTVKGTVHVGDVIKTASAEVRIDPSGVFMKGYMTPSHIGPLFISGTGNNSGAFIQLELSPTTQSFLVSGKATLLGAESETDIEITNKTIAIRKLNFMLFNLLKTQFSGENRGTLTSPNWHLKGSIEQGFEAFSQNINAQLHAWLTQAQKDIGTAKSKATSDLEKTKNDLEAQKKKQTAIQKVGTDIAKWFVGAAETVAGGTLDVSSQAMKWIDQQSTWINQQIQRGPNAALLEIHSASIEIDASVFTFQLEGVTFLGKQRPNATVTIDMDKLNQIDPKKVVDFIAAQMVEDLANIFGAKVKKK